MLRKASKMCEKSLKCSTLRSSANNTTKTMATHSAGQDWNHGRLYIVTNLRQNPVNGNYTNYSITEFSKKERGLT